MLKKKIPWRVLALVLCLCSVSATLLILPQARVHAQNESVNIWLTTSDQSNLLTQQNAVSFTSGTPDAGTPTIAVNENIKYQQMQGFGASMNDLSAGFLYNGLSADKRAEVLNKLFDPVNGIGLNLVRQPMGQSDQDYAANSSYDDNGGNPDPSLSNFSIAHDQAYLIPVLQQAYSINPQLRMIATPWTPGIPSWMRQDCGSSKLAPNPQYFGAFANYFVKFIQAYGAVSPAVPPVWAVTPWNEPPCFNYDQQKDFIGNYLAPALKSNSINASILAWDYDWDGYGTPDGLLGDSLTGPDLAGAAWHHYSGSPADMDIVQNDHPDKGNYFTEGSAFYPWVWQRGGQGEMGQNDLVENGVIYNISPERNWSQTAIEWTIANGKDSQRRGSCGNCGEAVEVDATNNSYTLTPYYYALGHTSKFVQRGAYRIDSNSFDQVDNSNYQNSIFGVGDNHLMDTAYLNPDGSKVLVAVNNQTTSSTFAVQWGNEHFTYTLPAEAIATFKWSGSENDSGVTLKQSGNDFNTDGNLEGWSSVQNANLSVANGSMHVDFTNYDPQLESADKLNIDTNVYRRLHIRLKNNSPSTQLRIDWTTNQDTNFDSYKQIFVPITANDSDYKDYTVDIAGNELWDGTVKQILLHPNYYFSIGGSVDIDSFYFDSGVGSSGTVSTPTPTPTSVAGTQLFSDDFEDGSTSQWSSVDGSWSVCQVGSNSKEYCGADNSENISLAGNTSWSNYSVQSYVVANNNGNNQGLSLLARVQDGTHFYQAELKNGNVWDIYKNDGGNWTQLASGTFNWSANGYYFLKFTVSGSNLSLAYSPDAWGDWQTLGSATDTTWSTGKIGVRTWNTPGRFDQVRVLTV